MDNEKKTDYFFKSFPFILTLLTVVIGLYQFNKGQKANIDSRDYQFNMQILSKFKETQQKVYAETMSLVGYLSDNTDSILTHKYKESYNRLKELYMVDLVPVESKEVDTSMVQYMNDLGNIWNNRVNYWSKAIKFDDHEKQDELISKLTDSEDLLLKAIKNSIMDWSLPGGLKGLSGKIIRKDE